MANYSITPANVVYAGRSRSTGIAGAAVVASDWLYKDAATSNVLKLAKASGTAEEAEVIGIALSPAQVGQPVTYLPLGALATGSVWMAAGNFVFLSATAGKCCPQTDLVTGNRIVLLGWSTSATAFYVNLINTLMEKPA